MSKFFLLFLLVFVSLTSCAGIQTGFGPDSVRSKIFSVPDWSAADTDHLQVVIKHTYSGQGPESWTAATNPNVIYTVSDMRFLLNSDYYVKQFVIQKEDQETGITLTDVVIASKKKSGAEFWTWRMD